MTDNAFDAAGYIQIDLSNGTIKTPANLEMILIPHALFNAIPATRELKEAARGWGKTRGLIFKKEQDIACATMDILASHLQGEIALIGAGSCSIDVLGDALMVQLSGTIASHNSAISLIEGFIAGYFCAISSVDFDTVSQAVESKHLSVFVGNPQAVVNVREKVARKMAIKEAVGQLRKEVA